MTSSERKLIATAVCAAVLALIIAIAEPRTAASVLGLLFVVVVVALAIRSLDQLFSRLSDHSEHDGTQRTTMAPRELPQDIDTIRNVVISLHAGEAMPSPVTLRLREIAAPRLASRFQLIATDVETREQLAAVVSPALFAVLIDERRAVPMAYLPNILDELERM